MATKKAAKTAPKATRKVADVARREEPAPESVEPAPAPKGPNIVYVRATGSILVVTERIVDRERITNGVQPMVSGDECPFILTAGQSLRIVEGG